MPALALGLMGQRGDDKLDVRIGAVYALEQIARDLAELHWQIIEVVSAYLNMAHLEGANLGGAHLEGAYLLGVLALTPEQLEAAADPERALELAARLGVAGGAEAGPEPAPEVSDETPS